MCVLRSSELPIYTVRTQVLVAARAAAHGGGACWLVCVSPVTSQVHRHSRLSKKALTSDTFFSHLDAGARRTLKI